MKMSRKMKKFFVTVLTVTLSIIMFVTSTSAANTVSYCEYFEHEGVVSATESMSWGINRNLFVFGVDLECYESDIVDFVYVSLHLDVYYPTELEAEIEDEYEQSGIFTYLDTEESDELSIAIPNFNYDDNYDDIEIVTTITYLIAYENGAYEFYEYRHNIEIIDGEVSHNRRLIWYYYDDENVIE